MVKTNQIDPIDLSSFTNTNSGTTAAYIPLTNVNDFTILTVNFISKLVMGEASFKNISGPVGIAGYAADSFNNGYTSFLGLLRVATDLLLQLDHLFSNQQY